MNFLNNARNGLGPLRQKRKDQFIAYFRNAEPTAEEFAGIAGIVVTMTNVTVRAAVEAIDPGFEQAGRIPDGFTVARALKLVLSDVPEVSDAISQLRSISRLVP